MSSSSAQIGVGLGGAPNYGAIGDTTDVAVEIRTDVDGNETPTTPLLNQPLPSVVGETPTPSSIPSSLSASSSSSSSSPGDSKAESLVIKLIVDGKLYEYKREGWFKDYKPEEMEALIKKYKKSPAELEAQMESHKSLFYLLYIEAILALVPEVPFLFFQINTGRDGIKSSARLLHPDLDMSDDWANGINIGLSSVDFVYNVHTFGPLKGAMDQVFRYANWHCRKDFTEAFVGDNYKQTLKKTFATLAKFFANQSILQTHNITGAVANLISVYDDLPESIRTPILVIGTYLGAKNYTLFANQDYYDGQEFWLDKEKPWLLSEMRRGNFSIPFETFLQGSLGGVGMRSLSFYAIALMAQEILGWWLPPAVVATNVAIHTYFSRYPGAYDRYMGALLEVRSLVETDLEESIDSYIDTQVELRKKFNPDIERKEVVDDSRKAINEMVDSTIEGLIKARGSRESWGHAIKSNPSRFVPPFMLTVLTAYFATIQQIIAASEDTPEDDVSSVLQYVVLSISAIAAVASARAAKQTVSYAQLAKDMQSQDELKQNNAQDEKAVGEPAASPEEKAVRAPKRVSTCEKVARYVSYGVSGASQGIRLLSSIGTSLMVPGFKTAAGKLGSVLVSTSSSFNGFFYTQPKVEKVFVDKYKPLVDKCCPSAPVDSNDSSSSNSPRGRK